MNVINLIKSQTRNGVFLIVALAALISTFYMEWRPYYYCVDEKKFLSDEDFIVKAIWVDIDKFKFEKEKISNEEFARSFHLNHPGCCSVTRHSETPFGNIFNTDRVVVEILFERREFSFDEKSEEKKYYRDQITLSACGKKHEIYGESVLKGDMPAAEVSHCK